MSGIDVVVELEPRAGLELPSALATPTTRVSIPWATRLISGRLPIRAALVRTALQGAAAYQLLWFDAHLWAYAEHYGLEEIVSEDFEHGRLYGSVRIRNPFRRGEVAGPHR